MKKAKLQDLLEKNATPEGLTEKEYAKARKLINNPVYSKKKCWLCNMAGKNRADYQPDPAIYNTGLCQGHARYALATRK